MMVGGDKGNSNDVRLPSIVKVLWVKSRILEVSDEFARCEGKFENYAQLFFTVK